MNLSNVFLVQLPNFPLSFSLLFQWPHYYYYYFKSNLFVVISCCFVLGLIFLLYVIHVSFCTCAVFPAGSLSCWVIHVSTDSTECVVLDQQPEICTHNGVRRPDRGLLGYDAVFLSFWLPRFRKTCCSRLQDRRPHISSTKVKFALEQVMKPRGEVQVLLYSFFHLGARCRWVINATPRPFTPDTHCTKGWVWCFKTWRWLQQDSNHT